MNAVEIEQAVSELAEQPFDAAEFPYACLMALGNKDTTIKWLCTGRRTSPTLMAFGAASCRPTTSILRSAPQATSWQPSPPFVTAP